MATYTIRKGLQLNVAGAPDSSVVMAPPSDEIRVYPQEFRDIKPRLVVKEGDTVKRGAPLFHDKTQDALKFTSPAGGTIKTIVLGERRALMEIVLEADPGDPAVEFKRYAPQHINGLSRDELVAHLLLTGCFPLFQQRPFSRIPAIAATPKAIFVNGMNTAPFQPDIHVAVQGDEAAFQAGLDVLTRLTPGTVHLCLGPAPGNAASAVTHARNVEVHTFAGPHPAGNSSVHIHRIAPIKPHDVVWVIKAVDVILIGALFLTGNLPADRVIAVGGSGVKEKARKHYRVKTGAPLSGLLNGQYEDGDQRVIGGDLLSGVKVDPRSHLRFHDHSLTVIPENRERHFLGWMAPGYSRPSYSRLFLSRWLRGGREWPYHTNLNGSLRAMVLTGLYDQFLPMNILTDFLVRAVLAHDTDEAVKLGILEVDPEDFALCAYACPSKMDLVGIMAKGIEEVAAEGV